jgi:D-psicose/D-tagatose/L-ribulose 3-epimerase
MKIGVSAFAWTAKFTESHVSLLPQVREYGFEGFEIPMFVPGDLPVAALRKAFAANDLECTVCAILPAGINPISADAPTRARSLEHLKQCVETAAELGAHLLGGPLYAPIGYLPGHRPSRDERAWAVEAFRSLAELLDQHAITLSIEPVNRSETFFLRTALEAKALCEAIGHPRIGVTIDTFHANIEEKSIPAAIDDLGPHLKHLHASENDRGKLGSGHIDFAGIAKALRRIGYGGYLMIEGFGYDPAEASAPGALWADGDVSPRDLAVEGRDFVQALLAPFESQ